MVMIITTSNIVKINFHVCYESDGNIYWSSCQIKVNIEVEK
jgi:hypothetical protein